MSSYIGCMESHLNAPAALYGEKSKWNTSLHNVQQVKYAITADKQYTCSTKIWACCSMPACRGMLHKPYLQPQTTGAAACCGCTWLSPCPDQNPLLHQDSPCHHSCCPLSSAFIGKANENELSHLMRDIRDSLNEIGTSLEEEDKKATEYRDPKIVSRASAAVLDPP